MFISDVLSVGKKRLSSMLEAEILFACVLGVSREKFISHPETKIETSDFKKFLDFCERRAKGEPIAYLTNYKEFYGLDFYVDARVLIPRPETELLVEEAIERVGGGQASICDVGTGSGCIAIALAKNIPQARIVALDISDGALSVAKENCEKHGVLGKIRLIKSDLLGSVMSEQFDAVVANLPYVAEIGQNFAEPDVLKYEPAKALFAGKDGLKFFRELFAQIEKMPAKPRFLIAEIGFGQKANIKQLIEKYFGKVRVSWKNDLAGIVRCFTIYVGKT